MKRIISELLVVILLSSFLVVNTCSAEGYSPEELFNIGVQYYTGDGRTQDYVHAFSYFRIAGEIDGYGPALYMVGECYAQGNGVEQDRQKAESYYSLAATKGCTEAPVNLFDYNAVVREETVWQERNNERVYYAYNLNDDALVSKTLDKAGNAINEMRVTYDIYGKRKMSAMYDANGDLKQKYTYEYDEDTLISVFTYDPDNVLTGKTQYTYNTDGTHVATAYDTGGVAESYTCLDSDDRMTEFGIYAPDGKKLDTIIVRTYLNETDYDEDSTYYYSDGTSYHSFSSVSHDELGRMTRRHTESDSIFSNIWYEYYEDGSFLELTEDSYDGGATVDSQRKGLYNIDGTYTETATYFFSGQIDSYNVSEYSVPLASWSGSYYSWNYSKRLTYDKDGNLFAELSGIESYSPSGVIANWTAYDETHGHRISEEKIYGEDGKLQCEKSYSYNENGVLDSCYVTSYDENETYLGGEFFDACDLNGHMWAEANCTSPKTCSVCGITEGEPADHTWQEADCWNPRICSVCGITEGEPLGHDWKEATVQAPKTCSRCGLTEGSPLKDDSKLTPVSQGNDFVIAPKKTSPAEVTFKAPKNASVYIWMENLTDASNSCSIFLSPGREKAFAVPTGVFLIQFAFGDTWYGQKDLFGSKTGFRECGCISCEVEYYGYSGSYTTYNIELSTAWGDYTEISEDEFLG